MKLWPKILLLLGLHVSLSSLVLGAEPPSLCRTGYRSLGEFQRLSAVRAELRGLVRDGNPRQRRMAEALLGGLRLFGRSREAVLAGLPTNSYVSGVATQAIEEALRDRVYRGAPTERFRQIYARHGIPRSAQEFLDEVRDPRVVYTFQVGASRRNFDPEWIDSARHYAQGSAHESALLEELGLSPTEFRSIMIDLANYFDRDRPMAEVIPYVLAGMRRAQDVSPERIALLERFQRDFAHRVDEAMLLRAERHEGSLVIFDGQAADGGRIFSDPEGTFGTVLLTDGGIPEGRIRMIVPQSEPDMERMLRTIRALPE